MIEVIKYTNDKKSAWDDFVKNAKNGTFLFYRDYMEYHADRFVDYSLMVYKKNKLAAVFPANIVGDTVYSHQGLTFGGVISDANMKASLMLDLFTAITAKLKAEDIKQVVYKSIPHIYHQSPADEDLYALFRNKAALIRRDISTTIQTSKPINYSQLRKRKIKQATKAGIQIKELGTCDLLYPLLRKNLEDKHNATPVHSLEELNLLKSRFPNHIQFFICQDIDDTPIGGCVIYTNPTIAHVQYICSNTAGRELGALDLLFDFLINSQYKDKSYFDFGISTEQNGQFLNEGLINQKEGFGGRGICYDTYLLSIE